MASSWTLVRLYVYLDIDINSANFRSLTDQ
jgi:hypothetical protein